MAMGLFRFARVILVLLLGGRAAEGHGLEACLRGAAPIYAELDVSELRRFVASSPELMELVYEGRGPAHAAEVAAAEFAPFSSVDAGTAELRGHDAGAVPGRERTRNITCRFGTQPSCARLPRLHTRPRSLVLRGEAPGLRSLGYFRRVDTSQSSIGRCLRARCP